MSKSKSLKSSPGFSQSAVSSNDETKYFDFMALFFIVAYLIIDFFPYFETIEIIKPQFFYLTILNIVVGVFIYFNQVLLSNGIIKLLKNSLVVKAYLAFIALSAVSFFFAKNISLVLVSFTEILVVLAMIINLAILICNRLYLLPKIAFVIGVSALFQSAEVLYKFQNALSTKSLSDDLLYEVFKGNTGNMNILAASLMFKIPFLFIAISNYNSWRRVLMSFSLLLVSASIFFVSARASLLSLIIILIVYAIYAIKNNGLNKTLVLKLSYLIVPIVISVLVTNNIFKQAKLSERYSSTVDRLNQINTENGSGQRRLVIWKDALEMIKDKPFLGWGLGNYRVESIPYDSGPQVTVPLHAHNDFIELAVETGLLNALIYLSLFVIILTINVKRLLKPKNKNEQVIALVALMLLIVYGIDATFNFPFYRPTMQLCFGFLMVFTLVNSDFIQQNTLQNNHKKWLLIPLIAILPIYYTYYAYKTSNLEYLILSDDLTFLGGKTMLKGDDVVNRNPKIPNVLTNGDSFLQYSGMYYFNEKNFKMAKLSLDSSNKISPYVGRGYFGKYLIAVNEQQADSAYSFLKSSFYMRPLKDGVFNLVLNLASSRKDTTEILKMFDVVNNRVKQSKYWNSALNALGNAGYSSTGINAFISEGKKYFPNDSLVINKINEKSITSIIVKGQELFDAGKHQEALKTYNEGLKLDASNIYILQNIGFYYFNLNKYNDAIKYFKKALAKPGLNNGKTEYYLAISYLMLKDNNLACTYLKISILKGFKGGVTPENLKCAN
jgi:O-antigen ligase